MNAPALKILLCTLNYPPEQIGIGKYSGEMAEWLAERGADVRVITAPPYYPEWNVPPEHRARWYRNEIRNGVRIVRCPLYVPKRPTGLSRMAHLASFALTSLPALLRSLSWKPDVILTIEPPLFIAPAVLIISRITGARSWLHVQDYEVEAFFGLGFGSSSMLRKLAADVEAFLMKRFDRVSTISGTMLQRARSLGVPDERLSLIPNWVDTDLFSGAHPGRDFRSEWRIAPGRKVILYSGNMGRKQGLEGIIDVASELAGPCPELLFLLVGEGSSKSDIMREAGRRGLRNVIFRPLQAAEDLPSLLLLADVHLVLQKRGAAAAVMPSKLSGIFAAGGRVIVTADEQSELGKLVRANPGIAILAEPEDPEALSRAIVDAVREQERRNPVARSYAQRHLDTRVVLARFHELLSRLHEASPGA